MDRGQGCAEARAQPLAGMPRTREPFAGDPNGDAGGAERFDESRRNFLALVFCLMVGTAALPHILMRYYTTPSVQQARESVAWSLFFIFLLYFTAPALAVLVKYEIFNVLVGTPFDQLPDWIAAWSEVDPALLSVADVNGDGILQLGEIAHRRRHHRAGDAGDRRAAVRRSRAWSRPAAWPRRCRPPTACC